MAQELAAADAESRSNDAHFRDQSQGPVVDRGGQTGESLRAIDEDDFGQSAGDQSLIDAFGGVEVLISGRQFSCSESLADLADVPRDGVHGVREVVDVLPDPQPRVSQW